jgi:glycosyltransferase involved in cell wall biosynthesis
VNKRILYIVPHRLNRSPGQRFRCEHFIPWLEQNNYKIEYANLLSAWDDRHFYRKRNYILKFYIVIKTYFKRARHIRKVKKFDAVFIYREAFMLGTTRFEKKIKRKGVPIIYDFDDAIWLNDVSEANKELRWLKRPEKTNEICSLATLVITGNEYLANHAKQFNKNVAVIPTTIDTNYHKSESEHPIRDFVRIGWTGSSTTVKHFRLLLPVLTKLKEKYSDKLIIRLISDAGLDESPFELENIPWTAQDEIARLNEIDIGIMPLPNDDWSKGKCGFKGLQYMSMGKPSVMSPVGVNNEIIEHGKNGFLAETDEEWEQILIKLIEDKPLREKIGQAGRLTIEQKYSIDANKQKYLELFNHVIGGTI